LYNYYSSNEEEESNERPKTNSHYHFYFLGGGGALIKLFTIKSWTTSFMKKAERNAIQRIVDHPYRGLIYDRRGKLMVYNNPIFDLMIVPKEFQVGDTTRFWSCFRFRKKS